MCRNDTRIFLLRDLSKKKSKEFDRVTDWLKHSLQAIVYVKYLFMFQNDYKRLGHSVICSIDYWLLYVNRKFKWYELAVPDMS
jgi:hypothetical protein